MSPDVHHSSLITHHSSFIIHHSSLIAMTLDLSEIVHNAGMVSHVAIDQECLDDPEIICLEPIEGRVDFRNSGNLLLIDGEVAATVELTCDRCLEPVTWFTMLHLEERFPLPDVINPPKEP